MPLVALAATPRPAKLPARTPRQPSPPAPVVRPGQIPAVLKPASPLSPPDAALGAPTLSSPSLDAPDSDAFFPPLTPLPTTQLFVVPPVIPGVSPSSVTPLTSAGIITLRQKEMAMRAQMNAFAEKMLDDSIQGQDLYALINKENEVAIALEDNLRRQEELMAKERENMILPKNPSTLAIEQALAGTPYIVTVSRTGMESGKMVLAHRSHVNTVWDPIDPDDYRRMIVFLKKFGVPRETTDAFRVNAINYRNDYVQNEMSPREFRELLADEAKYDARVREWIEATTVTEKRFNMMLAQRISDISDTLNAAILRNAPASTIRTLQEHLRYWQDRAVRGF